MPKPIHFLHHHGFAAKRKPFVSRPRLEKITNLSLIGLLFLAYPLTRLLPLSFAWENGPLEWLQVIIIASTFFIVFHYHRHAPSHRLALFWYVQLPVWLNLLGRETGWGAAFLPLKSFDMQHGPTLLSRRDLWYGQAVYPILIILFLLVVYPVIKYRLYQLPGQLIRERRFPALPLLIALGAIILSNFFEKHLFVVAGNRGQLWEEYLEIVFYLGLIATDLQFYAKLIKT
ncbi:MAG: hypothetical protein PVG90_03760 [Bacillota bacterium]